MINKKRQMNSFQHYYNHIVSEDLILKENITTINEIPKIEKIIISYSSNRILRKTQFAVLPMALFSLIAGQQPIITKAKKSISEFNSRKNQSIGCKLTLNKKKLFGFLEKLVYTLLPRLHYFQKKTINISDFNIGILQLTNFPELETLQVSFDSVQGCHIHLITSAKSQNSCQLLISSFKLLSNIKELRRIE